MKSLADLDQPQNDSRHAIRLDGGDLKAAHVVKLNPIALASLAAKRIADTVDGKVEPVAGRRRLHVIAVSIPGAGFDGVIGRGFVEDALALPFGAIAILGKAVVILWNGQTRKIVWKPLE